MIKKLWYYLFNKRKEFEMPKNKEEKVNEELTNTLSEHSDRIAAMGKRISDISDELAILKSDLIGFKRGVSRDIKNVFETIKTKDQ